MLTAALNITSLTAYLIGYATWYTAGFFHPEQQRKREAWYGFAQFKEQYQAAALLGLLATLFCVISPTLLIPAAWIYTTASIVWTIGEYHKNVQPSLQDPEHSSVRQANYFRYSLLSAISSGVATIATTVAFIFPSIALVAFIISTTIVTCLMTAAAYYWLYCLFGTFTPDNPPQSYLTMTQDLGSPSNESESDLDLNDLPVSKSLFSNTTSLANNDDAMSDLQISSGFAPW